MISGNAVIAGNGTIAVSAQYKLTIQTTGSGTTSPTTGEHTYDINEYVPVTAYPSGGWQLYNWVLDSVNVGSANPYTVTMSENHTIIAYFVTIPTYAVSIACSGASQIDIDGTTYSNNDTAYLTSGLHNISAVLNGETFYQWVSGGDVSVTDVKQQSTTITVTGAGGLLLIVQ